MRRRTIGGGAMKSGFGFSGAGAHDEFVELTDVPNDYTGQAGKVVVVKATEDGLEFNTEAAIDRHDVKASSTDADPQFLDSKVDNSTLAVVRDLLRIKHPPVLTIYDNTLALPVGPSTGDRYIALVTANGWTADMIYEWSGSAWDETVPVAGVFLFNINDTFIYTYVNRFTVTTWYRFPYVDDVTMDVVSFALVVKDLGITDAKVAVANKDGAAATPSMRTLGTGAAQACAGNDARLSDARTPTAHASTHNAGGGDGMAIDAAAATGSLRTLGTGAAQAATGDHDHLTLLSKTVTLYNPAGLTTTVNIICWRVPFGCTVTNICGYRVGGTGATVNVRKNGSLNMLASALSITVADTWDSTAPTQNYTLVSGDKVEMMFVSLAGSPTQVAVQIEYTKNVNIPAPPP